MNTLPTSAFFLSKNETPSLKHGEKEGKSEGGSKIQMNAKDTVYLKKEKIFLTWDKNVLNYKTDRTNLSLNLNAFKNIKEPLLSVIKNYLALKCNYSWMAMQSIFSYVRVFNNYLEKTAKCVSTLSDIDVELLSGYLTVIRNNPKMLEFSSSRHTFQALRAFYCWNFKRGIKGYSYEVERWLMTVKLPHGQEGTSLKTLDPYKGPYLRLELLAIDKLFGDKLNGWKQLNSLVKTTCIAYILSRETARRFTELVDLEVSDIYRDDETGFCFVKLHDRKTLKGGKRNKAHHRISDWIYEFITIYISETAPIRNALKTNRFFVHESQCFRNPSIRYISSEKQIYQHAKHLINEAALPNRIFFRQNEIKLQDIAKEESKKYRINLNSSRLRDTFGTHMAAMGVPLGLVAVRMGHLHIRTTLKYYVTFNPEIISQYLSEKTGDMFAKMAEYFSNPVVRKLTTSKHIRVMEDPDSLDFGGCLANYCNHHPLVACYGCTRLQPLVTREHKKNLTWLTNKREEIISDIAKNGGRGKGPHVDLMLQNIDRAVAVCRYIVEKCENFQNNRKTGRDPVI
jgi:integrase